MTPQQKPDDAQILEFTAEDLRAHLREALSIYVEAMGYPKGTVDARAPMWLAHMLRPGWRCVAALHGDSLSGIAYGYTGQRGQWWYEQVRGGLLKTGGEAAASAWMSDYFELTELHVRPDRQGTGLGERLLRSLLRDVRSRHVLLSTPEGESRAWRLYRRLGFLDVLRRHQFVGDPRPFAVLGRTLPL
ncbi:GNAT family N-acetyltransferase [Sciscionella sediminilitoris]|uniref:GNAT family N-acetyltransferase n=1 Tax=Sciscionella sediminilitoris TaxID=1445613 RepID=UPI0004DFBC8E|nr:GNAT family N-acetyltransferase [Sciscionella sp. SE31]